ncbi:MAG: hypothetical protein CMF46_00930 [Legionellales bacterium]|nr:hypothetical protein [Legionellales bacterium]|tara:strand:+ start:1093 stop:1353 length:261 start_codon:yes stop_codon:yes gene_type:complete
MASLLVKIFLSKDFELWKKSSSDLETVFNDHSLDIVMNKKVMGQNSVLLVIEGSPDDLALVFRSEALQKTLQMAGQGYIENMTITE